MKIKFVSTETKFPEDPAQPLKVRERYLSLAGVITLIGSGLAYRFATPRLASPLGITATTAGLLLAIRPVVGCLVRPCVFAGESCFPCAASCHMGYPSWGQHDELRITDFSGRTIRGHRISCKQEGETAERKVVIVCLPNGWIYDRLPPDYMKIENLREHDQVFFHPPGYGRSEGSRTPHSDAQATEAVLQALLAQGYELKNISVIGISIGSGPASQIAAKYKIGSVVLGGPFNQLSEVITHIGGMVMCCGLGKPLIRLFDGVFRSRFEYDNESALKEAASSPGGAERLVFYAGHDDWLMGDAADQLRAAWNDNRKEKAPAEFYMVSDGHGGVLSTIGPWVGKILEPSTQLSSAEVQSVETAD